ncbi:MAG: hypothetical protein RR921_02460 [Mucinivorans sp.]
MAKSNFYMGIVTVRLKAPDGYKPRVTTFRMGYISELNTDKFKADTMAEITDRVKSKMEFENEGVKLTATSSIEITPVLGIENLIKR